MNIFQELGDHMPQEDFLTAAFSFVLRQDPHLTKFLLENLFVNLNVFRGLDASVAELSVRTQERYAVLRKRRASRIVDLRISIGKKLLVLVESKIGAEVDQRQMDDYIQIARSHRRAATDVYVLLLTEYALPSDIVATLPNDKNLLRRRWLEISEIIEMYAKTKRTVRSPYLLSFIQFMDDQGMSGFTGFLPRKQSSEWEGFYELRRSAQLVLDDIKDEMKLKGFQVYKEDRDIEERLRIEDAYLGRTFYRKKWNLNFYYFVGFDLPRTSRRLSITVTFMSHTKGFKEFVRERYDEKLEKIIGRLEKESFIRGPDNGKWFAFRTTTLDQLLRNARSPQEQKRRILLFVNRALIEFRKSGMERLVMAAHRKYGI